MGCTCRTNLVVLAVFVTFVSFLCIVTDGKVAINAPTKKQVTCVYENKTYFAGQRFHPDLCTFCHCPRSGGMAKCTVQDCRYEPNCVRHNMRHDKCCGTCAEYGCLYHGDHIYHPGDIVIQHKCEKCICPEGGGRPVCSKVSCPKVDCVDAVQNEGDCCPVCPNGPNCYLGRRVIKQGDIYKIGKCHVCKCPTGVIPRWLRKKGLRAVCTMERCS